MTNLPSLPEFITATVVALVAMAVLYWLGRWWVGRPIPYPDPLPDWCVCQRRSRLSVRCGWAASAVMVASAVVVFGPVWISWLSLVGLAAAVVLAFTWQRLEWQTKWAHDAGRCCCPHGGAA